MNRWRFTIKFASGTVIVSLADEASFESALAEISEELPFDIDVRGDVAIVDDGDFDEEM